jgi:hypothetical protein
MEGESGQVFVCAKSPLAAMLEIDNGWLPTFHSATAIGLEVPPTGSVMKTKLLVLRPTLGASVGSIFRIKAFGPPDRLSCTEFTTGRSRADV